jgi:type II restriction/modification system DNA methylase subunit YeeA
VKDFILATLLVVGLNAMLWLIVIDEVSRPDVHKSWSSGKCIKVEHSKSHSCDNLPEKYSTVWVQ